MITKAPGDSPDTVLVTFEFPGIVWAESVHLVGDFNQWDYGSLPMSRSPRESPNWHLELELERGKEFAYLYLVNDTTFCNDCNADDYTPNPYEGHNSVVRT